MIAAGTSVPKALLLAVAVLAAGGLAIWFGVRTIPKSPDSVAAGATAPDSQLPDASRPDSLRPSASSSALPNTGGRESAVAAQSATRGRPAPGTPPRDFTLDRELTASAAAYKAYEEGMKLLDRLPIQAAARFREATRLDPDFAPGYYRLAMAAVRTSRTDEARAAVRRAALSGERMPEPYRTTMLVLPHFIEGAFDLTMAAMDEALARHPEDPDLRFLAGTVCARSCDYFDPNSVIEHYEAVLQARPSYPDVRPALMVAYGMKGMHDWPLSQAQESISRNPSEPQAVAELGLARIARGEYGDAIEAADELVRRGADVFAHGLAPAFILTGHQEQLASMYDPELERVSSARANLLTHLYAGVNDVWMGRFDKALEHFERGPEFAPAPWQRSDRALFFLLLGRTHQLLGRWREANSAFEAAQTTVGPQPVLEYSLGVNLLASGQRAEAERVVHRLELELRPSLPGWTEPWRSLMMGELALAGGDAPRALDAFRHAWQLEEPLAIDCIVGHVDAYFLDALGRGYLAARRPQEALQYFERVRALGARGLSQPEIVVMALYRSAAALEQIGRVEEAAARYRQFLTSWGSANGPPSEVREARTRLKAIGGAR